jgi:hemolysin D
MICRQVSRDSIENELLGLVYELYVDPQQTHLVVAGVAIPIATGMSVSVEVKVEKRRTIEFFLYPLIRYLDEGISVR